MFNKNKEDARFDVQSTKSNGSQMMDVITDKTTGVQYLLGVYPGMGSGMTVLVDKDGKPLLNPEYS